MALPQISMIGSGNVAWHLAPALDNIGYVVKEVHSRNPKNAHKLIDRLYQAEWIDSLDFSESESDLFIIAVSDDQIMPVCKEIQIPEEAVLVHISGSQPLSILEESMAEYIGVLYPLQTFSKSRHCDMEEVPFCIEANHNYPRKMLKKLANRMSGKVMEPDSDQRKIIHLSAVFACNFSNHLLTIAEEMLDEEGISFDILKPLIVETINKSLDLGPYQSQTGPASRGDAKILNDHMKMLKGRKHLAAIYKSITQHILELHNE